MNGAVSRPERMAAARRNAPEPIAGSHTFRAIICCGVGCSPSCFNTGSSALRTIGSVMLRGV